MSESIFERPAKPNRRVVVTGIGALTPLGNNIETSWENALNGQSGIATIEQLDPSVLPVKIAGEVKNFNAEDYIPKKELKKMDRFIHLAIAATNMAVKDSGLTIKGNEILEERTGAIVGVGMGGLPMVEKQHEAFMKRGAGRVSPFFIPGVITNLASGHISMIHGLRGPNFTVTSACASGAHSMGEAARYIQEGQCDVMIAGGSEAVVCNMAMSGFASMKALSGRNDEPELASRPWDQGRDGFVLAEAAGVFILEDYEHAKKRGARIYCELTGYGTSSDAYHMTSPAPNGEGAALAMKRALNSASLNPEDIEYINAHGTSTPVGDEIEVRAIKSVFKDHAKKLWVSSTKSMTGHALGAAGAIESAFCIKSLETNSVTPTINLENPSEGCDLDFVPGIAREKQLNHVLNNSFGFGGTNAVLIFSRI